MHRVWARGFGRVSRRPTRLGTVVAAALIGAGLAAAAHAAPAPVAPGSDFTPQSGAVGPQLQAPSRGFQWDARTGRWGLDLEMPQPTYNSDQWGQTRIGVHYRVGTNLRVGPTMSLAPEQTPDGRTLYQQQPAPRVRLETTLKF